MLFLQEEMLETILRCTFVFWILFLVVSLPWTWFRTMDDIIIYGDMVNMNISTFTMEWKFALCLSNIISFFHQGSQIGSDK